MVKIKIAKRGINRFGARKYAIVSSHSDSEKEYKVVKCRKKGTKHYYYLCDCPWNFYTRKTCPHIKDFITVERKIKK